MTKSSQKQNGAENGAETVQLFSAPAAGTAKRSGDPRPPKRAKTHQNAPEMEFCDRRADREMTKDDKT